ncbi:hypothetical protein V5738_14510 [Salinisphaera sp. SPP-AMP-43]|uniref:hypothetical protein n=1 Tax=Salinisphaera sp. SPP-AMP-43 TaxID=3121288 RepID=UPI003C6E17F9
MSSYELVTADIERLPHRSVYGPVKRFKRRLLRTLGRWHRADYDVHLVFEQDHPVYKKITFNDAATAARVTRNLQRFGPSQHLPQWRHTRGRQLWVEFVDGQPYDRMSCIEIDAIARCFTEFARRGSRLVPLEQTGYGAQHESNLVYLHRRGLIDSALIEALRAKSADLRPSHLRIGFDYRDPIAPNLVQRADSGAFCAIDIKNWHADTLVGEGLAKTTDRWLDPASRDRVLAHMSDCGLGDIAETFEFLETYERCARICRSVQIETAALGRIKKRGIKSARLAAMVDR